MNETLNVPVPQVMEWMSESVKIVFFTFGLNHVFVLNLIRGLKKEGTDIKMAVQYWPPLSKTSQLRKATIRLKILFLSCPIIFRWVYNLSRGFFTVCRKDHPYFRSFFTRSVYFRNLFSNCCLKGNMLTYHKNNNLAWWPFPEQPYFSLRWKSSTVKTITSKVLKH